MVAKYQYSPYGEILAITDGNGNDVSGNSAHIANVNPFRYRGYYYDTETGFYYLQSRYYDPVVGRFLNADDVNVLNVEQGNLMQYNAFAYCLNDPINRSDESGLWSWKKALKIATAVVAAVVLVSPTSVATATAVVTTAMTPPVTKAVTKKIVKKAVKAIAITCVTNNAMNSAYYNHVANADNIPDDEDIPNAYNKDGEIIYISRKKRLDYTKQQTGEEKYNFNAWRYYSEYSVHMYGWYATGWAKDKNIPVLSDAARRFEDADLYSDRMDDRPEGKIGTILWGILGF